MDGSSLRVEDRARGGAERVEKKIENNGFLFFLPLVTGFLVKQNPKNYLSNPFHLIDT